MFSGVVSVDGNGDTRFLANQGTSAASVVPLLFPSPKPFRIDTLAAAVGLSGLAPNQTLTYTLLQNGAPVPGAQAVIAGPQLAGFSVVVSFAPVVYAPPQSFDLEVVGQSSDASTSTPAVTATAYGT